MFKRIAALVAALLLVGGFALSGATPAMASTVHGCGDDGICMFNWESYDLGGSGYQTWGGELDAAANDCIDLYYKLQYDGRGANNRATSLVVNSPAGHNDLITFYDWTACNAGGGGFSIRGDEVESIPALGSSWAGAWNDRIGSIKLCKGCAP